MVNPADQLYDLAEKMRRCTACPLWKSRTLVVPGEGLAESKILFIGEAPGAEEDKLGSPFVGKSGIFLDKMLTIAGIERNKIYLTNSVKCHPPKNRQPQKTEIETCRELWLKQQIQIINPSLIILLGKTAVQSLLGKKYHLKDNHGRFIEHKNRKYFLTYHPAAGQRFPRIQKMMATDFKKLKGSYI